MSALQTELNNISKLFYVSDDALVQLTKGFGQAFRQGLQAPNQPVVMGPTFVNHLASGEEKGTVLVLDMSWGTVRVSKLVLDGNRSFTTTAKVYDTDKNLLRSDGSVFFGFLAGCVADFVKENGLQNSGLTLGWTFPFATQKTSLAHAKLLAWSKGYLITNVVGKDVVDLFQAALDEKNAGVKIAAILSDSVAAFLSESYSVIPCIMSAIWGVGTNGSYGENGAAITKLPGFQGDTMLINTEWGAFKDRSLLNPNVFDDEVDQGSTNSGQYTFQKLTTWYYLGEISRVIFLSFVGKGLLFGGKATDALKKHRGFPTFNLFQVEDAENLAGVKEVIAEVLEYSQSEISDQDAETVRTICSAVAVRGGKLAGAPMAALITHLGHAGDSETLNIAGEGELFIGSAQFETRVKQSLATILGRGTENRVVFYKVENGGVIGAAVAALGAQ